MPYFPPFSFNQPVDPYGIDYSQIQDPYDISELQRWARTPLPQVLAAEQTAPMSFDQRFNQLYQPQTQVTDEYTRLANQFPVRQQPGKLDRIAAAFLTAGTARPSGIVGGQPIGFELAPARERQAIREQSLYPDYGMQLNDWSTRLKALEPAMTAERYYNINARQTAAEIARREQEAKKIEETERKNRATEELRARDLANKEKRTLVYEAKANGWEVLPTKGGTVKLRQPLTGKIIDSGWESGTMTELDKINLGAMHELSNIQERGTEARKTVAARTEATGNDIVGVFQETGPDGKVRTFGLTRDGERREVSATGIITRPGTPARVTSPANETPFQRGRRIYNRAQQARIEHPEWNKYIKLLPNNTVDVDTRSLWTGDATEKELARQIHDYIFDQPDVTGPSNVTVPTQQPIPSMQGAGVTSGDTAPTNPHEGHVHTWPNGRAAKFTNGKWIQINGPRK